MGKSDHRKLLGFAWMRSNSGMLIYTYSGGIPALTKASGFALWPNLKILIYKL
jgi:hypothetical protein